MFVVAVAAMGRGNSYTLEKSVFRIDLDPNILVVLKLLVLFKVLLQKNQKAPESFNLNGFVEDPLDKLWLKIAVFYEYGTQLHLAGILVFFQNNWGK